MKMTTLVLAFLLLLLVPAQSLELSTAFAQSVTCGSLPAWQEEEPVVPFGLSSSERATFVDARGIVHVLDQVWIPESGKRQSQIQHYVLDSDGQSRLLGALPRDGSVSEFGPAVAVLRDGTIAASWVRSLSLDADDGQLVVSFWDQQAMEWSAPIVARTPISRWNQSALAGESRSNVWLFFRRGGTLRCKQVVNEVQGAETTVEHIGLASDVLDVSSVALSDGRVVAFWSSQVPEWPFVQAQYLLVENDSVSQAKVFPSPNGAVVLRPVVDGNGRLWVAYVNGLNSGQATSLMWTDDLELWSTPRRIRGHDGGQDCQGCDVAIDSRGRVLITSICDAEYPSGGFATPLWRTAVHRFTEEDGACALGEFERYATDGEVLDHRGPIVEVGARDTILVVFARGNQVDHETVWIPSTTPVSIGTPMLQVDEASTGRVRGWVRDGDARVQYRVDLERAGTRSPPRDVASATPDDNAWFEIQVRTSGRYCLVLRDADNGREVSRTDTYFLRGLPSESAITVSVDQSRKFLELCGVPEGSGVDVAVFDVSGRRVASALQESETTGDCRQLVLLVKGGPLAAGIYLVRTTFMDSTRSNNVETSKVLIR